MGRVWAARPKAAPQIMSNVQLDNKTTKPTPEAKEKQFFRDYIEKAEIIANC